MREITFTCDEWMASHLDNSAKEAGTTRSEAIRQIISQHMMARMIVDVAQREANRMLEADDE